MALNFFKGKGIKRLLGLDEDDAAEPAGAGGKDKDKKNWFDGIEMSIDEILREEGARFGKVHVISLADFRVAVGEEWRRLAGKVAMIADGVIQRHLGPGHLHSRQGDDTFLIVFRNIPEREARHRALIIADDLGRRLIGSAFAGLGANVRLGEVNAADLLSPDGTVNAEALAQAGATAPPIDVAAVQAAAKAIGVTLPPAPPAGRPPAEPRLVLDDGVSHVDRPDPHWEARAAEDGLDHRGARMVALDDGAPHEVEEDEPGWEDLKVDGRGANRPRMVSPDREAAAEKGAGGGTAAGGPGPADAVRKSAEPDWRPMATDGRSKGDGPRMVAMETAVRKAATTPDWAPIEKRATSVAGAPAPAAGVTPAEPVARKAAPAPDWAPIERAVAPPPASGAMPAPATLKPAPAPHTPATDPQWAPIRKSEPPPAPGAPAGGANASGAAGAATLSVVFRPAWNGLRQSVDTHLCVPAVKDAVSGTLHTGPQALALLGGASARLDGALAAQAAGTLAAMATQGRKGDLVLPLHHPFLRTARAVEAGLGQCAEAVRLLHLGIELVAVPVDAGVDDLEPVVAGARRWCRDVFVRVRLNGPSPEVARSAGAAGIGIDLADLPAAERADDRLPALLGRLVAATAGGPVHVWGVRRRPEALVALDAGCHLISGTVLMADVPEPRKAMAVTVEAFRRAASAPPKTRS